MKLLSKYGLFYSLIILNLCSCKVGEDYVREAQNLPETYRQDADTESSIASIKWWELFKDPILVGLIDTALESSVVVSCKTSSNLLQQFNESGWPRRLKSQSDSHSTTPYSMTNFSYLWEQRPFIQAADLHEQSSRLYCSDRSIWNP